MFFDSSADPSLSTNMARAPKRVGDGETYEFVGESQATIGEVRYSFNPQGAALSDGKKAFEKFPAGTTGFLVYRWGIDRDTDLAVGAVRDLLPGRVRPAAGDPGGRRRGRGGRHRAAGRADRPEVDEQGHRRLIWRDLIRERGVPAGSRPARFYPGTRQEYP